MKLREFQKNTLGSYSSETETERAKEKEKAEEKEEKKEQEQEQEQEQKKRKSRRKRRRQKEKEGEREGERERERERERETNRERQREEYNHYIVRNSFQTRSEIDNRQSTIDLKTKTVMHWKTMSYGFHKHADTVSITCRICLFLL